MFLNFNTTDNAVTNLDAGIGASTTTITVSLGEGVVFPSTNSILTLVQYNTPADPTSGILKSEKILMTSRSGDILTVTRGYDGSTATTFLSGDYVYLNVTSKVIEDIQDEVVRLEADKLDDGTLRTGLTANRVFKTDGSGNEVAITPTAGHVVGFDGSGNPTTFAPTLDINGLPAETALASDDTFVFYDVSTLSNYKITKQDIIKSINKIARPSISNEIQGSSDGLVSSSGIGWFKRKEIQLMTEVGGGVRISYDMRNISGSIYASLYLNGSAISPSQVGPITSTSFATYTYDIASINFLDKISLYTFQDGGSGEVKNFRMLFSISFEDFATVLL